MKRNGSALLIVLGMMAFMVVSAVSFAAYMRYSRLPSSYLRRSSSSRQLVKAAVARAIDAIDLSIANNPHPGVGSDHVNIYDANKNIWYGRVLCATNQLLESSQTVPVLTLEGLAYLPPSLVNDVRYFSRRTPTARWQQFGFDMGRYAFCAVDVSDYFDVNRMTANAPRSSSPARRMSLAYLFESGMEHTSAGSGAEEWDTFMEKYRKPDDATLSYKYDTLVPLVSIADFNLALGESGRGGFVSPFCRYISTSGGDGFYNAGGDDEKDKFRRMTFVTDSWFPEDDVASDDDESDYDEIYDLNDPECQPFTQALLSGAGGPRSLNTTTLGDIMASGQKAKGRLLESMPVMSLVTLFDYLDANNVPVSLACPTFERAPMICGIKPNINARFSLKLDEEKSKTVTDASGQALDPTVKTEQRRDVYATYEYSINPDFGTDLLSLTLQTLVVYPFAHKDGVADTSFNLDARATLFFSLDSEPVLLRTGSTGDRLHATDARQFAQQKGLSPADGTIVVPFSAKPANVEVAAEASEEDALFEVGLASTQIAGSEMTKEPIVRIRYKWTQTWDEENRRYDKQTKPDNATIDQAHCGIPPLNSKGEPSEDFTSDEKFLGIINGGGKSVTLNMALAVRVADSSGTKTYDLVPAHMLDDKTINNIDNNRGFPEANRVSGPAYPVMRFSTTAKFEFSQAGLEAAREPQSVDSTIPKAVRIDDPRFNYAPESWYDADGDISKQTWLEKSGRKARDGDIFLATSDQGYMQSIYELAFLPRLSDLQSVGGNPILGYLKNPDDRREKFETKETKQPSNEELMWSSYRPFATKAGDADDFEGLGFTSAGTGMQINPYTDCTNIMMAAFANTPVDWRMASTNNNEIELETMKASDFNKKYAWNEYGDGASKFKWRDLEAIAGNFMDKICPPVQRVGNGSYTKWQTAWRNLGWMYDPDKPEDFCGVQLDDKTELWGVDRKFLYGFWRDCFAAKQQLFLVFVRAEPLMMGGEGINQSPPQLGARAVALVWRDPANPTTEPARSDKYPHRTRVLFYRQFE